MSVVLSMFNTSQIILNAILSLLWWHTQNTVRTISSRCAEPSTDHLLQSHPERHLLPAPYVPIPWVLSALLTATCSAPRLAALREGTASRAQVPFCCLPSPQEIQGMAVPLLQSLIQLFMVLTHLRSLQIFYVWYEVLLTIAVVHLTHICVEIFTNSV